MAVSKICKNPNQVIGKMASYELLKKKMELGRIANKNYLVKHLLVKE